MFLCKRGNISGQKGVIASCWLNYQEVKQCYYALIAAKDKEECMDLYERVVTDIEDREEFVSYLLLDI